MSPTSIVIPTIKWGKRKERSQMFEFLTVDGRWVDKEMPALYNCGVDDVTRTGVIIDPENQYLAEDNNWHQLVWENSQIPLCLRKSNTLTDGENDKEYLEEISNDIFRQSSERAQAAEFEKAKKNDAWNKVMWMISIVCGSTLLIAAMQHFWK